MNAPRIALWLITTLTLVGCQGETASKIKEAWNQQNDPIKLNPANDYETKFHKLPREATLSSLPWSGDYWPTYKGGITYRWNAEGNDEERYSYDLMSMLELENLGAGLNDLSPAEKLDIYKGEFDYPLTNYERNRTQIMKTVPGSSSFEEGFEIPKWEGLCHAWAPATYGFKEPKPVTVVSANNKVMSFGSSDIKALLIMAVHMLPNAGTTFLGERCNEDFAKLAKKLEKGEITRRQFRRAKRQSQCRDTNAGAFHIVLANQIAFKDHSFVVDVTRDAEVWNQAVEGFTSEVIKTRRKVHRTAAPGTVREVLVETAMAYTTEVPHSWQGNTISAPGEEREGTAYKYYKYWLELDRRNNIIGGRWVSEERPDFLWQQKMPEMSGYFKDIKDIYEKSIK